MYLQYYRYAPVPLAAMANDKLGTQVGSNANHK